MAKRIQETITDNKTLTKKNNQSQAESDYNKKHIQLLNDQIDDLTLTVTNTNISLIKENDARIETKERLTLELKVMDNDAILFRELVTQKENLQTQIEKAFSENKMNESKDVGRSRLSVQSRK